MLLRVIVQLPTTLSTADLSTRLQSEVEDKTGYNPYQYSMKIYTTMDKDKQDALNDIMDGKTSYIWENDVVQAGVVAIDNETGGIRCD